MKKILLSILTISTALLFSACGGGGGGGGSDAHFKNDAPQNGNTNQIAVIDCNASVAVIPDDYTTMLSGDTLVNETSGTTVTTYHDINGIKKVCTLTGSAYLLR